jgi:hypothetical protein
MELAYEDTPKNNNGTFELKNFITLQFVTSEYASVLSGISQNKRYQNYEINVFIIIL